MKVQIRFDSYCLDKIVISATGESKRKREVILLLLLKAANCVLCRNSIYSKGEYFQVVEIQIQIPNHLARSTYQLHLIVIVEVKRERREREKELFVDPFTR